MGMQSKEAKRGFILVETECGAGCSGNRGSFLLSRTVLLKFSVPKIGRKQDIVRWPLSPRRKLESKQRVM